MLVFISYFRVNVMMTTTYSDPSVDSDPIWWKDPATIQAIRHHAHLSGLLYRPLHLPISSQLAGNMSVTLQPSKFPEDQFHQVWDVQPSVNSLVDAVSRDVQFLKEALERLEGPYSHVVVVVVLIIPL